MEKLRICLLTLVLLGFGFTAGAQGRLLRFDEPEQKVDSVRFDSGVKTLRYPFENISGKTVTVLEVHSGCGCFTGSVKKAVLAPGERGELIAAFDPRTLFGPQNRHLTVVATDGSDTVLSSVGMSGYVVRDQSEGEIRFVEDLGLGLRTDTTVYSFHKDSFGDLIFSFPLYNDTDEAVSLTLKPASWRLLPTAPAVIPARSRVDVRGSYFPLAQPKGREVEVRLGIEVNGTAVTPLTIIGTIN